MSSAVIEPRQPTPYNTAVQNTTICQPKNRKRRGHCKKVHQLNGCGHQGEVIYLHCGRKHADNPSENKNCYDQRWQPAKSKKVIAGNDYCNNACKASVCGWICCSCRIF